MMRRHLIYLTVAALGIVPVRASAQTLFATRGLGAPIAPTDARAAALGGVGTGLLGLNMSLENPADAAGLLRRGGTATLSPSWNSVDLGNSSDHIGGSRFPLIRVFYPVNPKLVASLAYGAYLDQTWGVRFNGSEVLGTDTVTTSDVLRSTGGISQLRFGFSYAVSEKLAVGAGGGLLTGSLDRSVQRTFADSVFDPFESRLRWSYRAPQAALGFRFDPAAGTRVAGSVIFAGKLKAIAEDSAAQDRTYGSSMKMNVGASSLLTRSLMATVGASREKYPEITSAAVNTPTGVTAGASTRDTWQYGGGLEYGGLRTGTRVFPFRVGARYQQLPYAGVAETAPKEFSVSVGTGYNLTTDTGMPQALFDLSLERASRKGFEGPVAADGLKENFWRMNFTLSLFGR